MPSRTPTRSVSHTGSRADTEGHPSLAALIRLEIDGVRMQFCVSRDRVFLIRGFHTPSSQPRKTVNVLAHPDRDHRIGSNVSYATKSAARSATRLRMSELAVHDTRPVAGEVLARGVCKTCAGIWKRKIMVASVSPAIVVSSQMATTRVLFFRSSTLTS